MRTMQYVQCLQHHTLAYLLHMYTICTVFQTHSLEKLSNLLLGLVLAQCRRVACYGFVVLPSFCNHRAVCIPVQAMIQEHQLHLSAGWVFAQEQVGGMGVAVHISMDEHHLIEGARNQLSHLLWLEAKLLYPGSALEDQKIRKYCLFGRLFDEKPGNIPGCPNIGKSQGVQGQITRCICSSPGRAVMSQLQKTAAAENWQFDRTVASVWEHHLQC